MPPEISEAELKELKAAKEERDALKKAGDDAKAAADKKAAEDAEAARKKKEEEDKGDPLRKKVEDEKNAKEKEQATSKQVEQALAFNMAVDKFVEDHKDLLPGEVPELLKAANKETYDTAADKAKAIKSAVVQSFFAVKENYEALITSQKSKLDDFLKLTKTGKESKADEIYENVFEPALDTMKRLKKAEEVGKANRGFASGGKAEDEYKNRLVERSKKTYLRSTKGA